MSRLRAQSIRKLCRDKKWFGLVSQQPMIVPFVNEKRILNGRSYGLSSASYDCRIAHDLSLEPQECSLGNTIEDFYIPHNVSADVADKSSFARVFVSAFNTFIDPGFQGNLTLELVNHGKYPVHMKKGDPICQIIFTWLDGKTDLPYKGKYTNQTGPQPAIFE